MSIDPLDRDVRSIAGTASPLSQHLGAQLPDGLTDGPVSAAQAALGAKLSATGHDHTVSIASALHNVQSDSTRRLLEDF